MSIFSSQKSFDTFAVAFALLCLLQSMQILGAMGHLASVLS